MAFVKVSNENVVCSPCRRLKVHSDATYWCKNCKEYICHDCFSIHKKIKMLSNHELTNIKEVPKETNFCQDIPGEVFCVQHPHKIATGFYLSDRKAYCFDCMQSMDLSLKKIIGVEKIAENLDSNMRGRDESSLHNICGILRKSITEIDSLEEDFNKSVEDILHSSQELALRAKEHIDELLIQLDTTLKELKNKEQKQILKRKTELCNFTKFLELRVKLLQSNTLTSMEILALSLKTKQELCAKSKSLRDCFEKSECYAVKFQPNRMFQQLEDLQSFGEIQIQSQHPNALNECEQVEDQINLLQQGLFPGPCAQFEVIPDKQTLETELKTAQKEKDIQRLLQERKDDYFRNKEVRIVLLGITGKGKSSIANTLLGKKVFETKVTTKCQIANTSRLGRDVVIVDTPGLLNTDLTRSQMETEIKNVVSICFPGIHAFLIVLSFENYTEQDQIAIEQIVNVFGQELFNHSIVVFTHRDRLAMDESLKEFISIASLPLKKLLANCRDQFIAIRNSFKIASPEREKEAEDLMNCIFAMLKKNDNKYYDNKMFQRAEERK